MEWVSVADAAERLGVTDRQVRRLASEGAIPARRVGGRWLIGDDGLRADSPLRSRRGRPVSASSAWDLLLMLDRELDGRAPSSRSDVRPVEDRKRRSAQRSLLRTAPETAQWSDWLRRRADPRRVWVHPGVVAHLQEDPRVHRSADADRSPIDARLYVSAEAVPALRSDHRIQDQPDGELILAVVPASVAEVVLGAFGEPIPEAVALVDDLSSVDARRRHLASTRLEGARASLSRTWGLHP